VISVGVVTSAGSYERELLRRHRRLDSYAPAVADAVLAGERAHLLAHRIDGSTRQIRAVAVHLLVVGKQLGPVPFERREEVLTRTGLEVEDVRPDAGSAGRTCLAHDVG